VPHLPRALQALWPGEALLDGSDMLRPQRHPVPENLQVKTHRSAQFILLYMKIHSSDPMKYEVLPFLTLSQEI
jgi:hypothetical protein